LDPCFLGLIWGFLGSCRAQVLYYAVTMLLESGHEAVYAAVERPLQFAQTAAFLEVWFFCYSVRSDLFLNFNRSKTVDFSASLYNLGSSDLILNFSSTQLGLLVLSNGTEEKNLSPFAF
jgi:hypothetical protein